MIKPVITEKFYYQDAQIEENYYILMKKARLLENKCIPYILRPEYSDGISYWVLYTYIKVLFRCDDNGELEICID